MHVGLGLGFRAEINHSNLAFARQIGATHIVASLLNGAPISSASSPNLVASRSRPDRWNVDALIRLRRAVEDHGLVLAAIESLEPADWFDVLLDGQRREEQIAGVRQLIRNLGEAGIGVLGYNFSLAGIWGRKLEPVARGGAMSWRFSDPQQTPIPAGMVWNQVYDASLLAEGSASPAGKVSSAELWDRYRRFQADVLPVAEEAGVRLALHPDDPALPTLRGTPRLVFRPELYDRVLQLNPSPSNCMAVCVGTLSEVPDSDIYEAIEHLGSTGRLAYLHFRNIKGKAPRYDEMFVDDGDTDMLRVFRILAAARFDGWIVPDHTPELSCDAPWHAGMAYALGWMRASLASIGALSP